MSRYTGRLPTTYDEAVQALSGKHVRTLLNNTRASQAEDSVEIQYHGNTIATFHADGTREFTTCGWGTSSSTRERLNAMLRDDHVGFIQKDYVGYIVVRLASGDRRTHHADTIEIQPNGSINSITNSRES